MEGFGISQSRRRRLPTDGPAHGEEDIDMLAAYTVLRDLIDLRIGEQSSTSNKLSPKAVCSWTILGVIGGGYQETYLMKANSLMIAAALFLTITLPAALDPPDVIVGSDQDNMSEVAEWYCLGMAIASCMFVVTIMVAVFVTFKMQIAMTDFDKIVLMTANQEQSTCGGPIRFLTQAQVMGVALWGGLVSLMTSAGLFAYATLPTHGTLAVVFYGAALVTILSTVATVMGEDDGESRRDDAFMARFLDPDTFEVREGVIPPDQQTYFERRQDYYSIRGNCRIPLAF